MRMGSHQLELSLQRNRAEDGSPLRRHAVLVSSFTLAQLFSSPSSLSSVSRRFAIRRTVKQKCNSPADGSLTVEPPCVQSEFSTRIRSPVDAHRVVLCPQTTSSE